MLYFKFHPSAEGTCREGEGKLLYVPVDLN